MLANRIFLYGLTKIFLIFVFFLVFLSPPLFALNLKEVVFLMVKEKQGYHDEEGKLLKIRKYREDKKLQKMAQEGDPQSQYKMGLVVFLDGEYKEAREWFQKSAEQGYLEAERAINYFQKYNEIFQPSQKTAKRSVNVQYEVALMSYVHDFRLFPNGGVSNRTVKWLERAAKKNHLEALFTLGVIYHQNRSPREAKALLSRAARQNHVKAKEYLSRFWGSSSASRRNASAMRRPVLRRKFPAIYSSGCADTWRVPSSTADTFE